MRSGRVLAASGLALALLCAAGAHAVASAFLMPPGEGDVITATEFSGSTRAFDQNGSLIPIPAYRKFELGSYIEYGLTDRLTLIVQPFFETARQDATAVSTPGMDIGARFGLARFGSTIISVQGVLHTPFESVQFPGPDFDEDSVFYGDFRLLLGQPFEIAGAAGFLDLQGGYRRQNEGLPDEWHGDITVGIRPQSRVLVMVQAFSTLADRATAVCARYAGIM